MKKTIPLVIALVIASFSLTAAAQEDGASSSAPVRASEYQAASPDEPQVVIRPGKEATYYEYRVNGQLREIRVEPKVGPVYYLVPADGGGFIRQDGSQLVVPKWVLFRW
ncbi:DUF2782 domain-containing protein [Marinobacter bohaiensis]|uniref:DUF2782 domain-containing protein n=1 Tax=Marinobacter bohaiensis TaxID=2201898 RepID=UPI000DAEFB20|nr:DUF2782 domain-containing protein [Marinobacter bohaiensis]